VYETIHNSTDSKFITQVNGLRTIDPSQKTFDI